MSAEYSVCDQHCDLEQHPTNTTSLKTRNFRPLKTDRVTFNDGAMELINQWEKKMNASSITSIQNLKTTTFDIIESSLHNECITTYHQICAADCKYYQYPISWCYKQNMDYCTMPITQIQEYLSRRKDITFPLTHINCIIIGVIIEYLLADLVEISGDTAKDNDNKLITPRHILSAISMDNEFPNTLGNIIDILSNYPSSTIYEQFYDLFENDNNNLSVTAFRTILVEIADHEIEDDIICDQYLNELSNLLKPITDQNGIISKHKFVKFFGTKFENELINKIIVTMHRISDYLQIPNLIKFIPKLHNAKLIKHCVVSVDILKEMENAINCITQNIRRYFNKHNVIFCDYNSDDYLSNTNQYSKITPIFEEQGIYLLIFSYLTFPDILHGVAKIGCFDNIISSILNDKYKEFAYTEMLRGIIGKMLLLTHPHLKLRKDSILLLNAAMMDIMNRIILEIEKKYIKHCDINSNDTFLIKNVTSILRASGISGELIKHSVMEINKVCEKLGITLLDGTVWMNDLDGTDFYRVQ